ncbi:MAG: hypothetical protein AB8B83_03470 [Bdellovibrionales bacterium]
MNIKNTCAITFAVWALASFFQTAMAENFQKNDLDNQPFFIPAIYPLESNWAEQDYNFQIPVTVPIRSDQDAKEVSNVNELDVSTKAGILKSDSGDMVDDLMKKIPYSKQLKYTWDIIDGDVDLYFENLRADRSNRGITYKMIELPMIGKMQGSELKADIGKDSKLTFKSDYMPMVGHIDGLEFKASAGTDKSVISLRYKADINW